MIISLSKPLDSLVTVNVVTTEKMDIENTVGFAWWPVRTLFKALKRDLPTTLRQFPRPHLMIEERPRTACIQGELSSLALPVLTSVYLCFRNQAGLNAYWVPVTPSTNPLYAHQWFQLFPARNFLLSLWSHIDLCCNKGAFVQIHSTIPWKQRFLLDRVW